MARGPRRNQRARQLVAGNVPGPNMLNQALNVALPLAAAAGFIPADIAEANNVVKHVPHNALIQRYAAKKARAIGRKALSRIDRIAENAITKRYVKSQNPFHYSQKKAVNHHPEGFKHRYVRKQKDRGTAPGFRATGVY